MLHTRSSKNPGKWPKIPKNLHDFVYTMSTRPGCNTWSLGSGDPQKRSIKIYLPLAFWGGSTTKGYIYTIPKTNTAGPWKWKVGRLVVKGLFFRCDMFNFQGVRPLNKKWRLLRVCLGFRSDFAYNPSSWLDPSQTIGSRNTGQMRPANGFLERYTPKKVTISVGNTSSNHRFSGDSR